MHSSSPLRMSSVLREGSSSETDLRLGGGDGLVRGRRRDCVVSVMLMPRRRPSKRCTGSTVLGFSIAGGSGKVGRWRGEMSASCTVQ